MNNCQDKGEWFKKKTKQNSSEHNKLKEYNSKKIYIKSKVIIVNSLRMSD